MKATIAILVEYVGEQRGAHPPLAFVTDLANVADLDYQRDAFQAKHLPPRVHVCSRAELEALLKVCEVAIATLARGGGAAALAVTVAERGEQKRLNVRRFEIDRPGAASFLDRVDGAIASAEAKQSIARMRAAV